MDMSRNQIVIYGLPDDYYHRYREDIRNVSREDVAAVAQTHIRPNEAQIIIVGDAESIVSSVDALGLGQLTVI